MATSTWEPKAYHEKDTVRAEDLEHLQEGIASALTLAQNAPPTITDPVAQTGTVGTPTELRIVATNATSFSATGLPAGLSINPTTGRISGTPTTAETATVIVTASSSLGSALAPFTWTISAAAAPVITAIGAQTAVVGTLITPLLVEATNATSYSATGLPAGLTINSGTGRITGIPTTVETPTTTVTVTGPGGTKTTTIAWTITAESTLPLIRPGTEPKAETHGTELKAPEPVTGTVVGDLLLLLVQTQESSATVTTPEGWALVGGGHGSLGVRNFYVFSKVNDGSPMPTVKVSVSNTFEIRVLSIQGGSEVDVAGSWTTSLPAAKAITIPSVTTTANGDLAIAITSKIGGAATETTPGGWTMWNAVSKNQFRVFTKTQTTAGATGATTAPLSGTEEEAVSITIAVKQAGVVSGITAKLSSDTKSVEPVSKPGGTTFIVAAFCTAETGQDENTYYETFPASTTNVFGTPSHPWIALRALNAGSESIGPYTARIKTTPALGVPVVAKPPTQTSPVSRATSLQLSATESPTSYAATGLPPGLTLNTSTGLISGTPTTTGAYTPSVKATNATGPSTEVSFTWTISTASVSLTTGVVNNSGDHGSVCAAVIQYGAAVVRDEFGIGVAASTVKAAAEYYAGLGSLLQPLAGFNARIPSAAEAKGLGAWATALAALAKPPKYIEFGNETSFSYQVGPSGGKAYGERAKEAAEALLATGTGIKLIVQNDDGNTGSTEWIDGIFAAWPGIVSHAAFGGWTIHPYPNQHVFGEKDTYGVPKLERAVARAEFHGDHSAPFFATEWGAPSTSNGLTMADGHSLNWEEAAKLLEQHIPLLQAASKGRLTELLMYQSRDQRAEGTTEREYYFGAVQSTGAAKGAMTTFAKSFL